MPEAERKQSAKDRISLHLLEAGLLSLLLARRNRARNLDELESGVRHALFSGITSARALGRRSAAGIIGASLATEPAQLLVDAARAQRLAANHVQHIRVAASKAAASGESFQEALARTEWRAKSLAATEAFRAASEERLFAAETVQTETGIALLKEWNAQSDSCPICSSIDGETVPVGASFSIGTEPGSAHPSCRCWVEILPADGSKRAVLSVAPDAPKARETETPAVAAQGYLKEQHTDRKARAYERMTESRVVPERLRGRSKLLKESRSKLDQLQTGGLPLAELKFSRQGYREGSFNSVRRAYEGSTNATALATGRAIPPGSTMPLPPIRLGAYPGEGIHVIDGRHRMQVAAENGATRIRAEIYLYDKHADYVWVGTRNIPIPR